MRLVYLSSSKIPSRQANSIQVVKMCSAFAEAGHSVTLIAERGESAGDLDVWAHYGVGKRFPIAYVDRPRLGRIGSLLYGARAAFRLRRISSDFLYGRCPHSLAWSCLLGRPFAYEAHVLPRGFLRKNLERFLFRRRNFKRLVVISSALKEAYAKSFDELDERQIVVAHDGANPPTCARLVLSGPNDKERSALKVGYVGSLYPGKGMEMVAALARAAPAHEYHVIGGNGPVAQWRESVGRLVTFHGHVAPSKVKEVLARFDVLLLPPQTRVEAAGGGDIGAYMSPLKLFEYMAAGRPIVASKLPVIEEVLEHERTALIVDADDVEAWVLALTRLANDANLRRRLGDAAFCALKERFTWSVRAETVLAGLFSSHVRDAEQKVQV